MQQQKGFKQHGFSLIEVLVALIVLSIGLLGLAGLQAYGLKSNHGAYLRSQATLLSYEIIDSMRANRPAALSGAYDIGFDETTAAENLAEVDVATWKTSLARSLPDGDGSIETDQGVITVRVRWDESRIAHDEENAEVGADPVLVELVTRVRL